MAYIPPGSQEPFDKDRSYGQDAGFVSQHSGKIIIGVVVLVVIVAIAVISFALNNDDDEPQPEASLRTTSGQSAWS